MPHQCVQCNTIFPDGSKEILEGCSDCGGKFFFYIKKDKIEQAKQRANQLSSDQKKQIEQDVLELIGDSSHDRPVVLDLESINIIGPGQYELDLVNLFSNDQPLVYKLEDGKYVVDIIETFNRSKK
jgi:predicted  nucleic acid-binding Zn-ribbon protein